MRGARWRATRDAIGAAFAPQALRCMCTLRVYNSLHCDGHLDTGLRNLHMHQKADTLLGKHAPQHAFTLGLHSCAAAAAASAGAAPSSPASAAALSASPSLTLSCTSLYRCHPYLCGRSGSEVDRGGVEVE